MANDTSQFDSGAENGGSGSGAINDPSTNPTTTTVNGTGNGNPGSLASFQPPAGHPNPFVDARPFFSVTIGGLLLPGKIKPPEGCDTEEDWNQQKGTNGSFAVSVWKGSKLTEGIKITMRLHDAAGYDAIYAVRDLLRPKRGEKPPSHKIENAIINHVGIIFVTVKKIIAPKWIEQGAYWEYEIELNEFNPAANANTGAADPTKPADGSTPDGAQNAKNAYVLGAVKNA